MPHRRRLPRFVLAAALSLLGHVAAAADDPFATATLEPPRPSLLGAAEGATPCATTVGAKPLALVEVVDLALCDNPQTREVWASARAQAAQVGVARAAFLPSLDARAGIERDWLGDRDESRFNASLALSWMLYDFGARDADLENARQLLAAAAASQDDRVQAIFLAAVQAFYQAQATAVGVSAALESERASKAAFDAAEARYRAGTGTPADRLQAQTAWSQATLSRIRAEGNARNAQGALAAVTGRDAQQPLTIVAPVMPVPRENFEQDLDALVAEARRRRPDLRAAEAQTRAAEAAVEATRARGKPTVSLAASASNTSVFGGSDAHGGALGVNLNIPLFTGYASTYQIRAAEAQAEVRAAQRERVRVQVALDVWNAVQNLTTATASLRSTADLLASAEQSERVAIGRYKAGVGNILDALAAQSALASARQQRIQAGYDWNVARATLAQAMGSLDLDLLKTLADQPVAKDTP